MHTNALRALLVLFLPLASTAADPGGDVAIAGAINESSTEQGSGRRPCGMPIAEPGGRVGYTRASAIQVIGWTGRSAGKLRPPARPTSWPSMTARWSVASSEARQGTM